MLFYLGLGTCSSNSLILGAWFWGHQNYLICGAISILDAPDKPEGLMALPFHVHDSVHDVLQHSRPSDIPCAKYNHNLLGCKCPARCSFWKAGCDVWCWRNVAALLLPGSTLCPQHSEQGSLCVSARERLNLSLSHAQRETLVRAGAWQHAAELWRIP